MTEPVKFSNSEIVDAIETFKRWIEEAKEDGRNEIRAELKPERDQLLKERDEAVKYATTAQESATNAQSKWDYWMDRYESLSLQNAQMRRALENLLKNDSPYPLDEVASILIEAVQILLNEKNYDGDKHERFAIARNYASLIPSAVKFCKDALSPPIPSQWVRVEELKLLGEYVASSQYWKLEPHDQKERAAYLAKILLPSLKPALAENPREAQNSEPNP